MVKKKKRREHAIKKDMREMLSAFSNLQINHDSLRKQRGEEEDSGYDDDDDADYYEDTNTATTRCHKKATLRDIWVELGTQNDRMNECCYSCDGDIIMKNCYLSRPPSTTTTSSSVPKKYKKRPNNINKRPNNSKRGILIQIHLPIAAADSSSNNNTSSSSLFVPL